MPDSGQSCPCETGPSNRTVTEREFQKTVIEMARALGWVVAHFRPAKTSKGWRTPVQADGAGFPDLVLCKKRVLYRELKTDLGRLTQAQREWISRLNLAGADAKVWRPRDWPEIEMELGARVSR